MLVNLGYAGDGRLFC